MLISRQQLTDMGASSDIVKRFKRQTGNTDKPVEVATLVGGKNTYSDLLWLAGKVKTKPKIARFAKDCALINIKRIKPYTGKYAPIVDFLKSESARSVEAARAADAAVWAAWADSDREAVASAASAESAANSAAVPDSGADFAAEAAVRAAKVSLDSKQQVEKLIKELFKMNHRNAITKARKLVAGFMPYDELCRAAAHNLAERREVEEALGERGVSPQRKKYLEGVLSSLNVERDVIQAKHDRVASKVKSDYIFKL